MRKLDIVNYKEYLEGKGIRGKAIRNYLTLFETFLGYCQNDLKLIAFIPAMPEVEVKVIKFTQ